MTAPLLTLVDVDGPGAHPALWDDADTAWPARTVAAAVLAAERSGFTAVVLEDHPLPSAAPAGLGGRTDGLLRAAFAAPITGAIGLLPVVPALYAEPFHLASQLATLDIAASGRAGWVAVADPDPALAARHGRTALTQAEADGELTDVVEAVRRLWDSWEDDAVVRDVSSGRYLDRSRLHPVDVRAARFSIAGPSIVPRPPQGQPIVVGPIGTQAEVDAVLLDVPHAEDLVDAVAEHARSARDRHPIGTRVLLRLETVLDAAGLPAGDRLAALDARRPWRGGRARWVGGAPGLVALLGRVAAHVDGVRFSPADGALDLAELGRAVLPALRAAGLASSPRAGDTARRTWGLPRPANRFQEADR